METQTDRRQMVGSIGKKGIGKLGVACTAVLLALGAGPAIARAEPPSLAISTPGPGAWVANGSPTISGTTSDTTDPVSVEVLQNGSPVSKEFVSPQAGVWSVQPSLPDGACVVVARQTDSITLEEGGAESSFTIDTSAPTLSLSAVPVLIATSTPTFEGSGSDEPGDEPVHVLIDGTPVGEAPVSGEKWTFTPAALADGSHTLSVERSDEAGNASGSLTTSFRIDTSAPTLSLNAVPAVIATSTPTFEGNGSNEPGDGPVHVLIDGKPAGEAPLSGGKWSFTSGALGDGSHTLRVERSDEAGNASEARTASFRIDTSAPKPTVTAPKPGPPLTSSRVEFKGTAGNATGDSPEVIVEIFRGSSISGEKPEEFSVKRAGSSWSSGIGGPRLANGTYTVRVTQTDSAGHVGPSPAVTFSVESPAPNVTLDELPRFTANPAPSFGGSADTSAEAKSAVTVKIWPGASASSPSGKPVQTVAATVTGGTWTAKPGEALADGTYTAQAEQPAIEPKLPAGVSETTTFTVDTRAPTLTLVAPSETTGLETVSGVAGADPGDRHQITAEVFSGLGTEPSALFETITVNAILAEGRATWSATFAGLPGGQYTVVAHQSDEAGNVGTSDPQSFTVNAPAATPGPSPTAPAPPSASFTWVPAEPAVGQSVSFISKSAPGSSPLSGFSWDLTGGGQFSPGGAVTSATFATAGAHTVRLRVGDANGLSSVATETIHVAPRVPTLMQPFPIVRIAGAETSYGAKIRLLSVQAPPTAKIAVSCKGRGCKTKSESRVVTASSKSKSRSGAVTMSFPRFQRSLNAGAVLQIRVSKPGLIGKFTSFTIRHGKLPARVDACLRPSSTKPSPCPSQ